MRRTHVLLTLFALIVLTGAYFLLRTPAATFTIESQPAARGTVRHIVNVTGHAAPLERLELGFAQGGRIGSLLVHEGDMVRTGELLASLDTGVAGAEVSAAAARARRERALLTELLAPTRDVELAVKDAAVDQADAALVQARANARAAVARAYVSADDAVHDKLDELFVRASGGDFRFGIRFEYGTTDYIVRADNAVLATLSAGRTGTADKLNELRVYAEEKPENMGAALAESEQALAYIEQFATDVGAAVNRYIPTDLNAQTVYRTFQSTVSTARTAVSAARAEVVAAASALSSAESTREAAVRARALAGAGAAEQSVSVQEASIDAANASLQGAAEALRLAQVVAPIRGVVSQVHADQGEMIGPYQPILELITPDAFELEAYIPEADIARVKLGDRAKVTFDAFDRTDVFEAEVFRIALGETVREGVPTYKTTLVLLTKPEGALVLRAGMTADIDIQTDIRDDVVYVPTRSILTRDATPYVRVVAGGSYVERNVEVGLRGSDGFTEIVSGVDAGEEVVLFVEEK